MGTGRSVSAESREGRPLSFTPACEPPCRNGFLESAPVWRGLRRNGAYDPPGREVGASLHFVQGWRDPRRDSRGRLRVQKTFVQELVRRGHLIPPNSGGDRGDRRRAA